MCFTPQKLVENVCPSRLNAVLTQSNTLCSPHNLEKPWHRRYLGFSLFLSCSKCTKITLTPAVDANFDTNRCGLYCYLWLIYCTFYCTFYVILYRCNLSLL